MVKSNQRVFIEIGFGIDKKNYIKEIADTMKFGVIDLVDDCLKEILRRKELIISKIKKYKGFDYTGEEENLFEILQNTLYQSSESNEKNKIFYYHDKSPLDQVLDLINLEDEEESNMKEDEQDEQILTDEIYYADKDFNDLILELEDMEESPEKLEEEVFKEILNRTKNCFIILRTDLKEDEQKQLTRSVEEILETLQMMPDHLISIYSPESIIQNNLSDPKKITQFIKDKEKKLETNKKKLITKAINEINQSNNIIHSKAYIGENMDSLNFKDLEKEFELLGGNIQDVMSDLPSVPSFQHVQNQITIKIKEIIDREFEKRTELANKLFEINSYFIPIKNSSKEFDCKNKCIIKNKIDLCLDWHIKVIHINGIHLLQSEENENVHSKLINMIQQKRIKLNHDDISFLNHFYFENYIFKFPLIYQNTVYFLKDIDEFWDIIDKPSLLFDMINKSENQFRWKKPIKIFLNGYDRNLKNKISGYIQEKFGLVPIDKQTIINDVLFNNTYSHILHYNDPENNDTDENQEEEPQEQDEEETEIPLESVLEGIRLIYRKKK